MATELVFFAIRALNPQTILYFTAYWQEPKRNKKRMEQKSSPPSQLDLIPGIERHGSERPGILILATFCHQQ
jgi:hypothetical protein